MSKTSSSSSYSAAPHHSDAASEEQAINALTAANAGESHTDEAGKGIEDMLRRVGTYVALAASKQDSRLYLTMPELIERGEPVSKVNLTEVLELFDIMKKRAETVSVKAAEASVEPHGEEGFRPGVSQQFAVALCSPTFSRYNKLSENQKRILTPEEIQQKGLISDEQIAERGVNFRKLTMENGGDPKLCVVAFPAKFHKPGKIDGPLADLGDVATLLRFWRIGYACDQIKQNEAKKIHPVLESILPAIEKNDYHASLKNIFHENTDNERVPVAAEIASHITELYGQTAKARSLSDYVSSITITDTGKFKELLTACSKENIHPASLVEFTALNDKPIVVDLIRDQRRYPCYYESHGVDELNTYGDNLKAIIEILGLEKHLRFESLQEKLERLDQASPEKAIYHNYKETHTELYNEFIQGYYQAIEHAMPQLAATKSRKEFLDVLAGNEQLKDAAPMFVPMLFSMRFTDPKAKILSFDERIDALCQRMFPEGKEVPGIQTLPEDIRKVLGDKGGSKFHPEPFIRENLGQIQEQLKQAIRASTYLHGADDTEKFSSFVVAIEEAYPQVFQNRRDDRAAGQTIQSSMLALANIHSPSADPLEEENRLHIMKSALRGACQYRSAYKTNAGAPLNRKDLDDVKLVMDGEVTRLSIHLKDVWRGQYSVKHGETAHRAAWQSSNKVIITETEEAVKPKSEAEAQARNDRIMDKLFSENFPEVAKNDRQAFLNRLFQVIPVDQIAADIKDINGRNISKKQKDKLIAQAFISDGSSVHQQFDKLFHACIRQHLDLRSLLEMTAPEQERKSDMERGTKKPTISSLNVINILAIEGRVEGYTPMLVQASDQDQPIQNRKASSWLEKLQETKQPLSYIVPKGHKSLLDAWEEQRQRNKLPLSSSGNLHTEKAKKSSSLIQL